MSLPACQERMLSGIEKALRAGEPRMASRFTIFTRLTSGRGSPRTEQLMPQPWLQRVLASAGRACRSFFPRSRSRGIAAMRALGRPAARLRAVVVLPVLLIIMASATVATAIAGTTPAHRRRPPGRHPDPVGNVHRQRGGRAGPPQHGAQVGHRRHLPFMIARRPPAAGVTWGCLVGGYRGMG